MVRLLSFVLGAFIFSCTIIEDSDITSQLELDNLRFTSIEMKIGKSSGTTTATATVTVDSAVNISVVGGILNRTLWMDWPALGDKLKLKGGFSGEFKSYTSYLESGKPWTFYLFDSDTTILEVYNFRYDGMGRLSNIITRVPYVQGGPATSNDTLIYGSQNNLAEITSIIRRSSGTSQSFNLASTGGSIFSSGWSFDFQGNTYSKACQGSGCQAYYGGNYSVGPTIGGQQIGQPTGVLNITDFYNEGLIIQDRNHSLDQYGCMSCVRSIDTFYFHPLMLLKDQLVFNDLSYPGHRFRLGDILLFIYMVDWWRPVSAQETTKDETVTFSFRYDL
jgi:hypothetical protein